jgi:hypothetical protein
MDKLEQQACSPTLPMCPKGITIPTFELSGVVNLKIDEARGLQRKNIFHSDQPASLF